METEVGADESVTTAVRRAVSAVVGREPGSLEPLTDVVDPAALDAVGHSSSSGTPRPGSRFTLEYHGLSVTVHDGKRITLEAVVTPDDRTAPPGDTERGTKQPQSGERELPENGATPVPHICHVCQRPIRTGAARRQRGELVHDGCRAERRCGISFGRPRDR